MVYLCWDENYDAKDFSVFVLQLTGSTCKPISTFLFMNDIEFNACYLGASLS